MTTFQLFAAKEKRRRLICRPCLYLLEIGLLVAALRTIHCTATPCMPVLVITFEGIRNLNRALSCDTHRQSFARSSRHLVLQARRPPAFAEGVLIWRSARYNLAADKFGRIRSAWSLLAAKHQTHPTVNVMDVRASLAVEAKLQRLFHYSQARLSPHIRPAGRGGTATCTPALT